MSNKGAKKEIKSLNDEFLQGDLERGWNASHELKDFLTRIGQSERALFGAISQCAREPRERELHEYWERGELSFFGEKIVWKLYYYAPSLMALAQDPADPDSSLRVLFSMMPAEEKIA